MNFIARQRVRSKISGDYGTVIDDDLCWEYGKDVNVVRVRFDTKYLGYYDWDTDENYLEEVKENGRCLFW